MRDGLKPVQRRVLFSMIELNNGPDKPHRKCARIVGDTMGIYKRISSRPFLCHIYQSPIDRAVTMRVIFTHSAVGMATNIPPHNLKETIHAVVKIIDNRVLEDRETSMEELLEIIKGPDFPTGAL